MKKLLFKETSEEYGVLLHNNTNELDRPGGSHVRTHNVSRLDRKDKSKAYFFGIDKSFDDKNVYLENYGNKLAEVSCLRKTVVVEREGDKVRIALYQHKKFRKVGKTFFSTTFNRLYLTYNLKTNNFYITDMIKSRGQRMWKRVRCNNFIGLGRVSDMVTDLKVNGVNDDSIFKCFLRELSEEFNYTYPFSTVFIEIFIKRNGFKGPNNMIPIVRDCYPGKKLIKKHNGKVVSAILTKLNLNSKYFNSVFNDEFPDIGIIVDYMQMLGPKYTRTIDKKFFKLEKSPYRTYDNLSSWDSREVNSDFEILTDYDRKNIVKLINNFTGLNGPSHSNMNRNFQRNITGMIKDHINIMTIIKPFEPELKFTNMSFDEFIEEHSRCSERLSLYKNSEEIYYLYDEKMVERVNSEFKGAEFKLLTNDLEYIEESTYQSNCIRTYVDKFKSVIISLRKDKERVTMEFNRLGECIQKRSRFNDIVPEHLYEYTEHIESIMRAVVKDGLLKDTGVKVYNRVTKTYTTLSGDEMKTFNRSNNGYNDFVDYLDVEYDNVQIDIPIR